MNKRSGTETKEKILRAALKTFSGRGYSGVSIREIAKASAVSVGGLYIYFRNKGELYRSLIKESIREKEQSIKKIVEAEASPSRALSALLEFHLDYAKKNKDLILMNIKEHGFTLGMDIRKEYFRRQVSLIEDMIQSGIKENEFRKCNAHETAEIIMAALRGIVLSTAMEDRKFITAKGLNEFLMYGLLRKNDNRPKGFKLRKRVNK